MIIANVFVVAGVKYIYTMLVLWPAAICGVFVTATGEVQCRRFYHAQSAC